MSQRAQKSIKEFEDMGFPSRELRLLWDDISREFDLPRTSPRWAEVLFDEILDLALDVLINDPYLEAAGALQKAVKPINEILARPCRRPEDPNCRAYLRDFGDLRQYLANEREKILLNKQQAKNTVDNWIANVHRRPEFG